MNWLRLHRRSARQGQGVLHPLGFGILLIALLAGAWCDSVASAPVRDDPAQPPDPPVRVLTVAESGILQAEVILPDTCDGTLREAAELLSEHLGRIVGTAPVILGESAPRQAPLAIHVGRTAAVRDRMQDLDGWDEDEFLIEAPDFGTLLLVGASSRATEYAVCELLQRFCGVRWLFPGALGTEIPGNPSLRLKVGRVRERPAFLSRRLSAPRLWGDYRGPAESSRRSDLAVWAHRHRHHGRVDYSHSLGRRLFDPERLAETHPEIFPVIEGKRLIPLHGVNGTSRGGGWQPCFTHPQTLKIGLAAVLEALCAQPAGGRTFALGVNDREGHCTCDACRKLDGDRLNYVNSADHSRSYFTWANALAQGVASKIPEVRLGFLAYNGVAEPPGGMPVHPALVPYITSDRLKWADPRARARDQEIHQLWHAAVPEIGWYDYIYGLQYKAPRVYFHLMADYLRWGHAQGVRHYTAEAYPADDWHEGPKLSLTLALLWNPALDVDAFLEDWYVAAVGPDAAPLLREYFAFWETYWTTVVPQTAWFRSGWRNQYFLYRGTAYLEALRPEDVAGLRRLAERLPELAPEGKRERARFLAEGMRARLDELQDIAARNAETTLLQPGADERVLLQDAFHALAPEWTFWTRRHAELGRTILGEMDGRKGVLRIEPDRSGDAPFHLIRSFDLAERGRIYRATFRVKGVRRSDPVSLSVRFRDSQKKTLHDLGIVGRPLHLSSDVWQDAVLVFNVPEDFPPEAASFSIHLSLPEGGGDVLVDAFTLAVSTPD